MNYTVIIAESADADFDRILGFIARDNPKRAISYVNELRQKTTKILSAFPSA